MSIHFYKFLYFFTGRKMFVIFDHKKFFYTNHCRLQLSFFFVFHQFVYDKINCLSYLIFFYSPLSSLKHNYCQKVHFDLHLVRSMFQFHFKILQINNGWFVLWMNLLQSKYCYESSSTHLESAKI